MGLVFNINDDGSGKKKNDTSVAGQLRRITESQSQILVTRKHIKDTCFSFPFAQIYIIVAINDDQTANLVKSGGDEYEFSYTSIPGEEVASNLFKLDSKATGQQVSLQHVPSIKGILTSANVGDSVQVGFYDSSRQKPYIRRIVKRGTITIADGELPVLESGLWSQPLSNCGLNPSVTNCFRPDPLASTLTVWSGTGGHYNDFPVMLDKDARPVLCFALRKLDNSNWDKLRIVIPTSVSGQLEFECNWEGSDTTFGVFVGGFAAISPDATIAIMSEANKGYGWRKRELVLEKLIFTNKMTNHGFYLANMSDGGLLCFPNYSKQPGGTISYDIELFAEVGAPVSVTNVENSTTNKIQFYDLDQEEPVLTNTDFDPKDLLTGYINPVVDSYIGNLPFNGSNQLITWASGRDAFRPNSTGFERAATINFNANGTFNSSTGLYDFSSQAFIWGKKLKAVVAAVDGNTTVWSHEIEVLPEDPILNDELIEPFNTVFATQTIDNRFTDANASAGATYPTLDWRPYSTITWSGICPVNRLTTNQAVYPGYALGSGGLLAFSYSAVQGGADGPATPISHGHWNLPQYDHFKEVKIELLPRGRNLALKTKHELDNTKLLNWNVFEDWSAPTAQPHGAIVVKKTDQSIYFAYTTPKQCFFGGASTLNGSISPLKNTVPVAFAEVLFDRIGSTDLVVPYTDDPDHSSPFYFDWDPFTYPLWTNGGGAPLYGIGQTNSFFSGPTATVECFLVRSMSYLSRRYIRKLSAAGALVWEKDLTQLVAGASYWVSKLDLGIRLSGGHISTDLIGAVSSTPLPLGDDMGPPCPVGRVVFLPCDFHDLGPNFLPTQKLLILNDTNGNILHTLSLLNDDEKDVVLEEDVLEPTDPVPVEQTDFFTGDGSTTDFELSLPLVEWSFVQVGGDSWVSGSGDVPFHFSSGFIIFDTPPEEGVDILVNYITDYITIPGPVIWYAGEKRYDATVQECYTGIDPEEKEWAILQLVVLDRITQANLPRIIRLKMGTNITTEPDRTTDLNVLLATGKLAINEGSIYTLGSTGGSGSILRKTNPSTT